MLKILYSAIDLHRKQRKLVTQATLFLSIPHKRKLRSVKNLVKTWHRTKSIKLKNYKMTVSKGHFV